MTGSDWIFLAVILGLMAGLISWQLDVGGWIARRVRARREAARFELPDHYDEKDWT